MKKQMTPLHNSKHTLSKTLYKHKSIFCPFPTQATLVAWELARGGWGMMVQVWRHHFCSHIRSGVKLAMVPHGLR